MEIDWARLEKVSEYANITRQGLDWNPQGKRTKGRPRVTWKRRVVAEI
jgi:hypothetical protein